MLSYSIMKKNWQFYHIANKMQTAIVAPFYFIFDFVIYCPFSALTLWLEDRKDIRPVKLLSFGMLAVTLYDIVKWSCSINVTAPP